MKSIETLTKEASHDFESLVSLLAILRSDEGCPWDRVQTHESIRKCLIEETYEVVDAIDKSDAASLREELGDLLFQVLFHSQIENEKGTFDVNDVINDVCNKMIFRHPHVFADKEAELKEVPQNWEELKKKEKKYKSISESFKNVPVSLPSLMKAQKITNKAVSKIGVSLLEIDSFLLNINDCEASDGAKQIFKICSGVDSAVCDLEKELNLLTDQFIGECIRIENE